MKKLLISIALLGSSFLANAVSYSPPEIKQQEPISFIVSFAGVSTDVSGKIYNDSITMVVKATIGTENLFDKVVINDYVFHAINRTTLISIQDGVVMTLSSSLRKDGVSVLTFTQVNDTMKGELSKSMLMVGTIGEPRNVTTRNLSR